MSKLNPLDAPRARYRFHVDTDTPCSSCLLCNDAPFPLGEGSVNCVIHDIVIADPARATCPTWVNGVPCKGCVYVDDDGSTEEARYHIQEKCPWCDYQNEIEDVADCQFEAWKRALRHLVGIHLLTEHPDQIAKIVEVFTGSFQSFCALAVDAANKIGRLADYGRKSGRVVGELNRDASKIGK